MGPTQVIFLVLIKYRSDVLNVFRKALLGIVSWLVVKIIIRCCFLILKRLHCSFNTYHEGVLKITQLFFLMIEISLKLLTLTRAYVLSNMGYSTR